MTKNNNSIKKIGRILFVDPNDVFGSVNGVPVTPDYSDMCISFKLECRVMPRYKQNVSLGQTNVTVTNKDTNQQETIKYSLNWNTPYGEIGDNQWISFLQGDLYNNGKDSSLTTYYTDINYDDYKKSNIVEGLGVDNVTISYENYYSPTISIKFVDHRGSSIFGREEVSHYDDKITVDNIFGAFFTAPYPLFRMQVKGFYGRAVTYQMTCTSFKGSLNSQTGNFEAVATFVGYSYSMLTDIPFEYLVATPYCKYVAQDYWNSKKAKEEWRMFGSVEGDEVPTLFELFQRINASFTNEQLLQVISDKERDTSIDSETEANTLYSIQSLYNTLFDMVKHRLLGSGDVDKYIISNSTSIETSQCLYMCSESSAQSWEEVKTVWRSLTEVIQNFNEAFKEDAITQDKLPKQPPFATLLSHKLFDINKNTNTISLVGVKEETVEELSKLRINDVQLNKSLCEAILDTLKKPNVTELIKPNVYVVDWGTLRNWVENKISELTTRVKEINRKTERNYLYLAIDNLGIIPYVGNIFKLVICHVETFVEMMRQCYMNIESAKAVGQRTPSYLNITTDATDVAPSAKNNTIPPWPSITKSNDATNYYLMTEKEDTFGWAGDFSEEFEEVKLVRALYLACKRTSADALKKESTKGAEMAYVPILPNDVNNNYNPFIEGNDTLSSMAGMVGIRATQIFGVAESRKIDDGLAKTIGKADAFNYYLFLASNSSLRKLLEQCDGNLAEDLYDIMLCNPSADKYATCVDDISLHEFEFAKGLYTDIERHPIFKENPNEALHYVYMPTKSRYGIVPSNTRSNDFYKSYFVGSHDKQSYFNYEIQNDGEFLKGYSFLHYCTATQLFNDYETPSDRIKYINNEMYAVITDSAVVNAVNKRYQELSGGNVTVMGKTYELDVQNILDHYWGSMSSKMRYSAFNNTVGYFTQTYKDNGVENKCLLGKGFDTSTSIDDTLKTLYSNLKYAHFNNESLQLDGTDVDVNNLVIPLINCLLDNDDKWFSLFGLDFYYMQNTISEPDVKMMVKALLFLHTLYYNNDTLMSWDDTRYSSALITRIPFGLAALYGGLLWRHNYILRNHQDPIQYGNVYKSAYDQATKTEYTLFDVDSHKRRKMCVRCINGHYHYRLFSDGKTTNYIFRNKPDYMVSNELINVFYQFVENQWKIISDLELRRKDGTEFKNGEEFSTYVKQFRETRKEKLNGKEGDELVKAKAETLYECANEFASFTTNYCFMIHYFTSSVGESDDKLILWLNTDNKKVQDALRSTYMTECIELRTMATPLDINSKSTLDTYGDIKLNISNVKSYLNGFTEQLKDIVEGNSVDPKLSGKDKEVVEDTPEFNRELGLPIYMYLKAIWDKWLVAIDLENHELMVKNFDDNFVFFDAFYRNIAHRFMCNCQLLLDCYSEVDPNRGSSVFQYLADVVNQHQLMFVGLPDFVSGAVSKGMGGQKHALEALQSMFIPVPYEKMNPIDNSNKFAVVYIPRLSEIPSEINGYKNDSFDIVEDFGNKQMERSDSFPDILKDDYALEDDTLYGLYLDYGYYVPSFGLTYGRQNNHFFKNINLSMETPIITSTIINSLSHTARLGASNTHRVAYVGQDVYPVFSNYSYICEFEMMGCAQIMPLMYFQLMNVPMWRGTYIIFSVVHNMTPGNMTTKVKAMKLSCRAVPYSNAWFTKNPNFDEEAFKKLQCLDELSKRRFTFVGENINNANTSENSEAPQLGDFRFSGDTTDKAAVCKACYQAFINAGATDAAAKGILANIESESRFRPDVIAWDGNKKAGKFGVGGGLCGFYYYGALPALAKSCGWTKSQLDAFNNKVASCGLPHPTTPCDSENQKHIARVVGKFPFTFEQQINHITSLSYFQTVKSYTDPGAAAKYWIDNYEKPASRPDRWAKNKATILKYLQS